MNEYNQLEHREARVEDEGRTELDSAPAEAIDRLVWDSVFAEDDALRKGSRRIIRELAQSLGIIPSSIHNLYHAMGMGLCGGMTVPASNIRGMTYEVAKCVFRAARRLEVSAFILEIARSEMVYTKQNAEEYVVCILAAAIREGFRGPVFIQGDHFQIRPKNDETALENEIETIKHLIEESISAGFLNIDIDASTLVDLRYPYLCEQQRDNYLFTAALTHFIRTIEPSGIVVSVGAEIGEVGKRNSTVEELRAFMKGYKLHLGRGIQGLSKISVQTGTMHGGVLLPDGCMQDVTIDFKTLEKLSEVARGEFGMSGAVQHGASTLPDEAFDMFPQIGTAEIHLATGFQNLIYDSPYFPDQLLNEIRAHTLSKYSCERKQGETDLQFWYKTRKKAFGDYKRELWSLPSENLKKIIEVLENRISLLFQRLNVGRTVELIRKFVCDNVRQGGCSLSKQLTGGKQC